MKKIDKRYLTIQGGSRAYNTIILDTDYILFNSKEDVIFRNIIQGDNYINDSIYMLEKLDIAKRLGINPFGFYGKVKVRKEYTKKLYKEIDTFYRKAYEEMQFELKKLEKEEKQCLKRSL